MMVVLEGMLVLKEVLKWVDWRSKGPRSASLNPCRLGGTEEARASASITTIRIRKKDAWIN